MRERIEGKEREREGERERMTECDETIVGSVW